MSALFFGIYPVYPGFRQKQRIALMPLNYARPDAPGF